MRNSRRTKVIPATHLTSCTCDGRKCGSSAGGDLEVRRIRSGVDSRSALDDSSSSASTYTRTRLTSSAPRRDKRFDLGCASNVTRTRSDGPAPASSMAPCRSGKCQYRERAGRVKTAKRRSGAEGLDAPKPSRTILNRSDRIYFRSTSGAGDSFSPFGQPVHT